MIELLWFNWKPNVFSLTKACLVKVMQITTWSRKGNREERHKKDKYTIGESNHLFIAADISMRSRRGWARRISKRYEIPAVWVILCLTLRALVMHHKSVISILQCFRDLETLHVVLHTQTRTRTHAHTFQSKETLLLVFRPRRVSSE